jgi:signal transduction histidine kinase/ligand-binding sensor domain-containing protein
MFALKSLAVLFLLFAFCSDLKGQAPQSQPVIDVYHSDWTTKDGAPRGVTSLAQSRDGYLWVATILGLYRFDGYRFSPYPNIQDTRRLPSTNITSLTTDEADGVWIGYDHGGISHIQQGKFFNIGLPASTATASVDGIWCCREHSVWVLAGGTILRWNKSSWEDFARVHGLPRTRFLTLFFDNHGDVWTSSQDHIYELRAGASNFIELPQESSFVTQFAEAKDGTLWISDVGRCIRPLASTCSQSALPLPGKASFLFDDTGKLWIGLDSRGVERVTSDSVSHSTWLQPESFTSANGLTSNSTHAILRDRFDNVWVGTDMGIDRFRRRDFQAFGEQDFKLYPALAVAPDGSVWIQKEGRKLIHASQSETEEIGPPEGISPLASDSKSGVWLFDPWTHRLLRYDSRNHRDRLIKPPATLLYPIANGIITRPDGSLLVAFRDMGLWSYSTTWKFLGDLSQRAPTTFAQSGSTTWIGYFDNLLVSIDRNRQQQYDAGDGLDIDTPLVLTPHDSLLWVGGTGGVDFVKDGHVHTLHPREPERFRGVSGLVFDNHGDLWLNTAFGAMRVRSTEVSEAVNDPEHRVVTKVFGSADGVIGIPAQTTPVPSLVKDGEGTLWFATAGNLVKVSPAILGTAHPTPHLDLQSVLVNGKEIADPENGGPPIVLDGGRENRIEFQFTAIDIDHPNHIIYRYQLEGEDKTWQMAWRAHEAIYDKLRPGHYRFRFAATNGEDEWTELPSPLLLNIQPAFYQTTWFLVACWITAVLCLWFIYLARIRYISTRLRDRIEERSNERLRIARELHDTLLQSIHGLMLRFHYAADSLQPDDPVRPALEAALKRADSLILEGRNSVQDLRGEADKTRRLAEMLAETVRDAALGDGPIVQITEEGIAYPLRPMVQEEFYKIGREGILNALHHAKATNVRVEVRFGRRFFRLICRDNGVGIPEEMVQTEGNNGHWGLKGMQERARSIGATFDLWTSEGKGTEIEVGLRSRAAYDRPHYIERLFAFRHANGAKNREKETKSGER